MDITPGGNPVCAECGRWSCVCDHVIHHSPDMSEEDARLFIEYLDWLKANRPKSRIIGSLACASGVAYSPTVYLTHARKA